MHTFLLPVILICFDPKQPLPKEEPKAVRIALVESDGIILEEGENPRPRVHCNDQKFAEISRPVVIRNRGNFSRLLPKKPFALDFDNKDLLGDVPDKGTPALLGMEPGSKWVLYPPFADRSKVRNEFVYDLARQMGKQRGNPFFAPESKPVEVFLNDKYWGLYNLTEKIERGKKKVNIPKLEEETQKDSIGPMSFLVKISSGKSDFQTFRWTSIAYEYPSLKKLAEIKTSNPKLHKHITKSISKSLDTFEERIKPKYFEDPYFSYRKMIDMGSFVDFFLVQEIAKNADGFRRSFYMYMTQDEIFHAGPVWDFDLAMGNINIHNMQSHKGWLHQVTHVIFLNAFWIQNMVKDPVFKTLVKQRFAELRKSGGLLHQDSINKILSSHANPIHDAAIRDNERWRNSPFFLGKIGQWMLNTKKKHDDFEANVAILREWLHKRMSWLEEHLEEL